MDWERLGLHIAGEAGNGSEALKALEAIVITDMNMPLMDGVSFLEARAAGNFIRAVFRQLGTGRQASARGQISGRVIDLAVRHDIKWL